MYLHEHTVQGTVVKAVTVRNVNDTLPQGVLLLQLSDTSMTGSYLRRNTVMTIIN